MMVKKSYGYIDMIKAGYNICKILEPASIYSCGFSVSVNQLMFFAYQNLTKLDYQMVSV